MIFQKSKSFGPSRVWSLTIIVIGVILALFAVGFLMLDFYLKSDIYSRVLIEFYGWAALLCLLLAMAFLIRKHLKGRRPGATRFWLPVHIYAGLFFALFLILHTGGSIRSVFGGPLYYISWSVILTGFLGHYLRKKVPPLMTCNISEEVLPDEINIHLERAHSNIQTIGGESDAELLRNFVNEIPERYYRLWNRRLLPFYNPGLEILTTDLERLRQALGENEQERLNRLEALLREVFRLEYQRAGEFLLRGWLYLHLPLSFFLLILTLIHLRVML